MQATVVSRTIRSSPHRGALDTWNRIVEIIAAGASKATNDELGFVAGIVSTIIADQAPKDSPIVVTCSGPRTRIYCTYDDDALDDSDANEAALGFNALAGDWHISLPCTEDDLTWVRAALQKKTDRITVREADEAVTSSAQPSQMESLTLDIKGFLRQ